jgi:DNA-binding response OmpR family regulator
MGGARTLLVVDDDPALRLLCRVNMELDGYTVLEAGSLSTAREIIGSERVDVALLDVHVGGDDGRELIPQLAAADPPIPVVLLTGSEELGDDVRGAVDAVVRKPFTPVELAAIVDRLTRGSSGSK